MPDALTSKGASLQFGAHAVANAILVTGPTQSAPDVDVTHLGVSGDYKQFLGGYLDAGELSFEIWYDPSKNSHKEAVGGLKHEYNLQTEITWTYTLSDASVVTFQGRVNRFEGPDVAVDEGMKIRIGVKVSGAVTMPS